MRPIAFLFSLVLCVPAASRADAKLSEFCSIAMPTIQAPYSCASERTSGELLEKVLSSYQSLCPGMQDRFEVLDQARQKLVHRCVLFNPNKREEPAGCAADRAVTAQSLVAFKGEVSTMSDRVAALAVNVASERPRDKICRVFHDQHHHLLTILKDRLHNLRMAADRAERESRAATPSRKDHERVEPSVKEI